MIMIYCVPECLPVQRVFFEDFLDFYPPLLHPESLHSQSMVDNRIWPIITLKMIQKIKIYKQTDKYIYSVYLFPYDQLIVTLKMI